MTPATPKSFVDGRIEQLEGKPGQVAVTDYPLYFVTYGFPPPAIWSARPVSEDRWPLTLLVDMRTLNLPHGAGLKGGTTNPTTFAKMLAKIAHGYGVAVLGVGSFQSPLTLWLRGKADLRFLEWIGSEPEPAGPATSLHEIELRVKDHGSVKYAVVYLRLFAAMATPRYEIVIGQLEPSFNQWPLFELPLHRIEVDAALPIGHLTPASSVAGMTRDEIEKLFKEGPG